MNLPDPDFRAPPASEPPALVRQVARGDVTWNRPIFKAPPLKLNPKLFDAKRVAQELRRIGRGQR